MAKTEKGLVPAKQHKVFAHFRRGLPKLLIGIDPGSNCGVATLVSGTKLLGLYQFKSNIEAMFFCIELSNDWEIELTIEDARKVVKNAYFAQKANRGKDQGVGYVKGYCKEWEAFCVLRGYQYQMVSPKNTKMDELLFEKLTGKKTLKTQHHMRDAALLIFGK